jgi:hypothetical protein
MKWLIFAMGPKVAKILRKPEEDPENSSDEPNMNSFNQIFKISYD